MNEKRLKRNIQNLTTKGKSLMLAYDHGIEHGTNDFSDKNINPYYILKIAREAKFNSIILQKGIAEKYYNKKKDIPLILKLNGKTSLFKGEPISRQICSVSEAVDLGAKGVGYTVYIGSEHESIMLEEFGKIEEEAHNLSLPIVAWMYPRGESIKELKPETIEYAARVGLEIGADFVKVNYTGSVESFKKVVEAAGKCKVLALGGQKKSKQEILKEAEEVVQAGACGLAIGRNIWQNEKPLEISKELKNIILKNGKIFR